MPRFGLDLFEIRHTPIVAAFGRGAFGSAFLQDRCVWTGKCYIQNATPLGVEHGRVSVV